MTAEKLTIFSIAWPKNTFEKFNGKAVKFQGSDIILLKFKMVCDKWLVIIGYDQ